MITERLQKQKDRTEAMIEASSLGQEEKDDYIDLRKVPEKKFAAIAATPSSALGSCRMKPTADDCREIFRRFDSNGRSR